jgi:hypothetical protein
MIAGNLDQKPTRTHLVADKAFKLRVRNNKLFWGFTPAVSFPALKAMRATIRELNIRRQTQLSLADIAHRLNPLLWGC